MKLSAIIGILMTGIGFLVLAFGGEFWSAPFFSLALILFAAAWKRRGPEPTARFIKTVRDLPNWESQWQERLSAGPKPERQTFLPKPFPEDPKADGLRKQIARTIPESPFKHEIGDSN